MPQDLQTLDDLLAQIDREVRVRPLASDQHWQVDAVAIVLSNLSAYRAQIAVALATAPNEQVACACRVSGIRKGILDFGLLDQQHDRELIDLIDQTDTLATRICLTRS